MKKDKVTAVRLLEMKAKGEKIAALTAYETIFASILDEIGVDLVLVGDTLGQTFAGYDTTLPVTVDQMVYHTCIVSRCVERALVVGDMPFMSFQVSPEEALKNVGRIIKEGGAEAVKLEGGSLIVDTVDKIVNAGIPVMGHIGLTPQSVHKVGGFKVQGREEKESAKLIQDAKALEEAGVFSLVLEAMPYDLAKDITARLKVPTIGIGAGPYCDGQILVTQDLLGLFERFLPKYVRKYAEMAKETRQACKSYIEDVKAQKFPSLDESYG